MEIPEATTGVELFVVVPLPSSPNWLSPHHFTEPPESTAQLWVPPVARPVAVEIPLTPTGVALFVVVPSPSSPASLSPQHRMAPATIAQVWSGPTAMAVAVTEPVTAWTAPNPGPLPGIRAPGTI